MKTGIELIAIERQEQIEKHGYDADFVSDNPQYYSDCELSQVACDLIIGGINEQFVESDMEMMPESWDDENEYRKMFLKPYKERLIIAGALIAAEIDRLQNS